MMGEVVSLWMLVEERGEKMGRGARARAGAPPPLTFSGEKIVSAWNNLHYLIIFKLKTLSNPQICIALLGQYSTTTGNYLFGS